MREVKFRAWHTLNKVMVYFDSAKLIEDAYQMQHLACLMRGDYGDVLMQFTGLKDKNGVDIYEGDIVCIRKNRFGVGRHEVWSIEYGYFGDANFYVQNNLNSGRLIEVGEDPYFSPDGFLEIPLEVIGNIHENPELLK